MKNTILISTLLLFVVLVSSCKKEEEPKPVVKPTLVTTEMTINKDQTLPIKVDPGIGGCEFTLSDEGVVSVTINGLVTGMVVGEVDVEVSKNKSRIGICKVTVAPVYQMYKEPFKKFRVYKSDVKEWETRELLVETGNSLMYVGENPNVHQVSYIFDNGYMIAAGCFIPSSKVDLLANFLNERYYFHRLVDGIYSYRNIKQDMNVSYRKFSDDLYLLVYESKQ